MFHLPLRYEDETALCKIADAAPNSKVQVEATVTLSEVRYRPRRTLIVVIQDDSGELFLRFLHFYPNQLKALQPGARLRVFGEVRHGYFGPEMVHPKYSVVAPGKQLPNTYTPVYPTVAGITQQRLRKTIAAALATAELEELIPAELTQRLRLPPLLPSLKLLHAPPPGVDLPALQQRTHPAWRRLMFEELLAHQLLMHIFRQARARTQTTPLTGRGHFGSVCWRACRST